MEFGNGTNQYHGGYNRSTYGGYGSTGYSNMGYGGMGGYGMGYGMGGMGIGGLMGGVMQKMATVSMSIGLLGQGVQMLGMNAEMIQNAITSLMQLLANSTHSLNDLVGCESDQSSSSMAALKLDGRTGQLVPKTPEELAREARAAMRRRRTARWVLSFALAALCWWRLHLRERRARGGRMADEFPLSAQQPGARFSESAPRQAISVIPASPVLP